MKKTQIFTVKDLTKKQIAEIACNFEKGAVAVFPTDTVYGIGTGAMCESAIQQIYTLKNRPTSSPLQVLVGSNIQAKKVAIFSKEAEKLATLWPGALTLVLPPTQIGISLSRGFTGIGLRMPNYPFLLSLLDNMNFPIASTSANLHGQTVLTTEEAVLSTFDGKVDLILLDGTLSSVASSVVNMSKKPPCLIREGGIGKNTLEQVAGIHF